MKDSTIVLQNMLDSFLSWFPDFTDHSLLHSLDVLDYSNRLLGENVKQLNVLECYVLAMSCYLHDIGMGISRKELDSFKKKLYLSSYFQTHPNADDTRIIRDFHNELSSLLIYKYSALFDIPSDDLVFAIAQVSKGHRKTDLYDKSEYPDLQTNGGVVRTAFLAAVLRLADEIDVGADRNPELLFDLTRLKEQADIDAFGTHESIKTVEVYKNAIILRTKPKEPRYAQLIINLTEKIQNTLDYCRDVSQQRSNLSITQKKVIIQEI